jgi:heme oxygenase (biliverdin-IX-beta and delta-forming)
LPNTSLRAALRAHTAPIHQRLDDTVGELNSRDDYSWMVSKTFAFRAAVEPSLLDWDLWSVHKLASLLRTDLADLAVDTPPIPHSQHIATAAANLGWLYVLEGSSVGARLLFQRAQRLGFNENYGARHLAAQAQGVDRWRQFVTLLDEQAAQFDRDGVLSGAQAAFEFAVSIYSEKLDERV